MNKILLALALVLMPASVIAQGIIIGSPTYGSSPFNLGNYGSDTDSLIVEYGFASTNSDTLDRYWPYTYVISSENNHGNMTVKWVLDGVVLRQLIITPGTSVLDYVACDSLYIVKGVALDTVQYGGCYNK